MKYDIIIIGGGPAGMMAAGCAAELSNKESKLSRILVIEKNREPGVKLLITGKDRCNITNIKDDIQEIVNKFGKNGKFLYSALNKFGPSEVINFFESRGLKTKIERGGRVFPESDKSLDVRQTLLDYLKELKVEIRKNTSVKKILHKDNKITEIVLHNGNSVSADKYILATGGRSYPVTGSTGDGYKWIQDLGHTLISPKPALTPIIVKEELVRKLEGLSLKNVKISVYQNNKKIDSRFGDAVFTFDGMSGPIIIDMSKKIGQALAESENDKNNKIEIKIDFKPSLDFQKLDKRIQCDFHEGINKDFKNSLDKLLPKKLIPIIIKLSEIDPDKKVNIISKEERRKLIHLLKEFTLEVTKLKGFQKAIITSGGVKLSEVDSTTMQSKLINNLFFAGEVLDLDGPTGGYNLQVCWSTGYVAGESCVD